MTTLSIAGWRIGLYGTPTWLDQAMADRYEAFIVPDGAKPDASVTVTLEPDRTEDLRRPYAVTRNGEVCLLDMPGGCGKIYSDRWQTTLGLERRNFWHNLAFSFKALLAYLALRQGGLLFHCAGLLEDGQVYIFTGLSGSGKSTVVALSPQATALNDDFVVLRPDGDSWWAFGTPFWNFDTTARAGETAAGPVVGVYKLVQDRREYLESVTTAVAAGELVANCPVVNGDPRTLPVVMDRCRQLVRAVPVYRLHFRKTPGFWELARGVTDR